MRFFAIIAASLASLCAAAALPADLPTFPSVKVDDVTDKVGSVPPSLSGRQVPAGQLDGAVSKVLSDVQARDEPSCNIPDLFDEVNVEIAAYIAQLNRYDNSCDASEVNGVLINLKAILEARLPLLHGLEGRSEEVVFTTAGGAVVLVADVAAKIAVSVNEVIVAARHLLTLDIVAKVELDLVAAVEAIVDLVEEAVVIVPELVELLNADIDDTDGVVAALGIVVEGGLCL